MEQEKKNQNQPAAQEPSVGDQIKVRRECRCSAGSHSLKCLQESVQKFR